MIELPKLQQTVPIVEDEGLPSLAFHRWWQAVANQVESQFTDILEALISMDDVTPVTIAADYTGAVMPSNQLPKNIAFVLREGSTDVTSSAAWSVVVSGGVTCTIGASTGILNVTAVGSSGVITVTAVYQGVTRTRQLLIDLSLAAPPPSGGGGSGTSSSTSTFTDINSASHAAIATLSAKAGSGGKVTLTAPLSVTTEAVAPATSAKVYGEWQWDSTGVGGWVDLASEVSSSPDCVVTFHPGGGGYYTETDGTLSVPDSKTGLTPGSSYNFRLMARNNSGTRLMSFYGTASAVGS